MHIVQKKKEKKLTRRSSTASLGNIQLITDNRRKASAVAAPKFAEPRWMIPPLTCTVLDISQSQEISYREK